MNLRDSRGWFSMPLDERKGNHAVTFVNIPGVDKND
jgi:hypothetical protein